jgi:hypothetical protein
MASIIQTRRDSSVVIAIVIPLIIFGYAMLSPHLTHPNHIAHIAIHEAGMLIAGFLLSLTIIAYSKTKLPRMLFSAAAFGALTFAQGIYLFLEQNTKPDHHVDFLSANEIFDTLIVIMTILFALGVFYNSRKLNNYK